MLCVEHNRGPMHKPPILTDHRFSGLRESYGRRPAFITKHLFIFNSWIDYREISAMFDILI